MGGLMNELHSAYPTVFFPPFLLPSPAHPGSSALFTGSCNDGGRRRRRPTEQPAYQGGGPLEHLQQLPPSLPLALPPALSPVFLLLYVALLPLLLPWQRRRRPPFALMLQQRRGSEEEEGREEEVEGGEETRHLNIIGAARTREKARVGIVGR